MKKIIKLLYVCTVLLIMITSCGKKEVSKSTNAVQTEKDYKQVVDEFIDAVDKRDKKAIVNMFSDYAKKKDKNLEKQIDKLFKIYDYPTIDWYYDELLSAKISNTYKENEKEISNVFPVVSNGKYFWCGLKWVQENGENPSMVGVEAIQFYTAEDYYVASTDIDNVIGLKVYDDEKLDYPICCIGGQPYKYNTTSRLINKSAVEGVLRTVRNLKEFKKRFGKPRAEIDKTTCFYEMFQENEESRFVKLTTEEDSGVIIKAEIFDNYRKIRTIINNTRQEK